MGPMKRARAVAGGMLVLIAASIVPAVSAAQETTTTTPEATTPETTTPDPASPPAEAAERGDPVADQPLEAQPAPAPATAPAPGPSSAGRAQASASARVSMGDFFFSPTSVSVAVGDTVTWVNSGQAPHNATANDGSFKTPDLNNGGSASHKFTSAGSFAYICTIHPQMTGTVRVLSSGGGKGGGGAGGPSTSATGDSEAAAVASPDAAGTSTSLPATGMAAGVLALVGLALLASGLMVRQATDDGDRPSRFLTIF